MPPLCVPLSIIHKRHCQTLPPACASFLRPESFLDTLRLARVVEMRCMQEAPVSTPLEVTEPQEGAEPRRITEESCDFSQIDTREPEIRRRLMSAYGEILKYRARRLSEKVEEE
jgi:hypothetical protein